MPLYSRLPHPVAVFIEAAMPVTLALLILVVVALTFRVAHTVHEERAVACVAVNRSNDQTYEFFKAAVGRGPNAHNPATLHELGNLRLTYDAIAKDCRLHA